VVVVAGGGWWYLVGHHKHILCQVRGYVGCATVDELRTPRKCMSRQTLVVEKLPSHHGALVYLEEGVEAGIGHIPDGNYFRAALSHSRL